MGREINSTIIHFEYCNGWRNMSGICRVSGINRVFVCLLLFLFFKMGGTNKGINVDKGKWPVIEPWDTTIFRDQEQEQEHWLSKLIGEVG